MAPVRSRTFSYGLKSSAMDSMDSSSHFRERKKTPSPPQQLLVHFREKHTSPMWCAVHENLAQNASPAPHLPGAAAGASSRNCARQRCKASTQSAEFNARSDISHVLTRLSAPNSMGGHALGRASTGKRGNALVRQAPLYPAPLPSRPLHELVTPCPPS